MEGLAGPQFADCVVPVWQAKAARDATWKAKQRWMEGSSGFHGALAGDGRPGSDVVCGAYAGGPQEERPFRSLEPMLGDDGKPLASLQAKANQHQRKLMKESSEKIAPNSVRRNIWVRSASAQAGSPGRFHKVASGEVCVDALHVLSKPKSGRAFGPDAITSELIAAGGQGLGALCAKVSKAGAPILWKGGDMAPVPRKPGPLTSSDTRGVLCSSCPGKTYASVLRAAAVP